MDPTVIRWAVFGGYLILMLAIGEVAARRKVRSLDDYLLAGRQHGLWITAGSLAATAIGAGSTIGAAGVAYYVGLSAGWYLWSAGVGLVLLGLTLGPVLRQRAVYTVPEFIAWRYGPIAGRLATVLALVGLVLFLGAQLLALGTVAAQMMGLPVRAGIAIAGLVVVVYAVRGGIWAIHWTDNLQLAWIVLGLLVLAVVGLRSVGGLEALEGPPAARGFEALGPVWLNPSTRRPVSGWDVLALGSTVFAWVIMSTTWHVTMQSTVQRVLATRDPATARQACGVAALVLVPLGALVALAGMTARRLYPGLEPTGAIEQMRALPALVEGLLDPFLGGIVLAALTAVVMSTCDSALLGATTVVVRDLWVRWGTDDTRQVTGSRRVTAVLGGVAIGCALVLPGLVRTLEMVAAVYCVSLFVPMLLGVYWRRATPGGAIASMVTGGLAGLLWRALEIEALTGVHMLTVALPASLAAGLIGSLASNSGSFRRLRD
ncbi:MAG: sodium:solute symporter family protein [Acidobacteria bacterium]|nr:sodium:solute symporter family protein [Acidobacteriota bacterium]MDW7983989.1 sodium:solute symporter family protein [Acidobacteriota bacterium]